MLREWFYNRLVAATSLPPGSVIAGGALTGSPAEDRFIVYRMHETTPVFQDNDRPEVESQLVQVWIYDQAGSYDWIDQELETLRDGLTGQIVQEANGIACRWTGTSSELADDELNRIVRNGQLLITGRV